MYQTITFYDFRDAFRRADRLENFSYDGAKILFDYLEAWEDGGGEPIELNVIALCCDFAEDDVMDIVDNYGIDIADCSDEDEVLERVKSFLEEHTMVCGTTNAGTIVYQQF